MKKTNKLSHELTEISFLQSKLCKIDTDELLDLHKLFKTELTIDNFIERIKNDRIIGRSSNYVQLFKNGPDQVQDYAGTHLFFCSDCGMGFESKYIPDDQGKHNILPCCPECNHSRSVTKMKKELS